jgi:hypothetical protein
VLAATVVLLGIGSITSHNVLNSFVSTEVKAEEDSTENSMDDSLEVQTVTDEAGITYTANTDGNAKVTAYSGDVVDIVIPKKVTIGEKEYAVTEIADNVFQNSSITKITANSVTKVGESAFDGCSALTTVDMPSLTEIGDTAFRDSGITEISAKDVTKVGSQVFLCTALTTVDMPSVTETGGYAFSGCTGLTNVNLPNLATVGFCTFSGDTGLTSIDLPSATKLADNVFYDCSSLETINMPNATDIGGLVFRGCNNLKTIDISSATSIDNRAFWYRSGSITAYVSEKCGFSFGDEITKRYAVADGSIKIVFDENDDTKFSVVVNKGRFGGDDDTALYLEQVSIYVDSTEKTIPLQYYTEEDDTITYYVKISDKPATDTSIRVKLQAYNWDGEKQEPTGDAIYRYSLPQKVVAGEASE